MKTPPNAIMAKRYRAGLGRVAGRMMLLLTTTGRKSGKLHTVAVQYEKMDGNYHIGAANGQKCDWYKNIQANPKVMIEVGREKFNGNAVVITGADKIADFLEYRLKKHPLMIGMILKMDGCSFHPDRAELLVYANRIGLVMVTPEP